MRRTNYWRVRLEVKVEDMWVGAFWRKVTGPEIGGRESYVQWDVWICLLPCLPIHITRWGEVCGSVRHEQ